MDALIIEPTEDSPSVIFDTASNNFIISGASRPENSKMFYAPVIKWITAYESMAASNKLQASKQQSLVFVFKLDYFNSSSAKFILDILLLLRRIVGYGYAVKVEWVCDKRDEDMLDMGRELSEMVDLKFEYIQY